MNIIDKRRLNVIMNYGTVLPKVAPETTIRRNNNATNNYG